MTLADRLDRQASALTESFDDAATPGLAVTGLANIEIAELLTIAKRTVDNHPHTTCAAVGVTGRDGLRALFG
ncbi:hypothetical protein, partial [Lentzea sp. NPDC060358]|uniref:hypothetical protein n=1 Tax=Lentzea sp. NPDC060358 TaxID=3347103 RepID=UPI00364AD27A